MDGEMHKNNEFRMQKAIKWLNRSQYANGFIAKFGSLLRPIDVYPEITGYAISTYVSLHRKFRNQEFLSRAFSAADAIIGIMQKSGAIPSIVLKNLTCKNDVYMFDQSVMANGLCILAEYAKEKGMDPAGRYLDAARRATNFIVRNCHNGKLFDKYDFDGNSKDTFSYCILGKCVIPLVTLNRIEPDLLYLEKARQISHYIVSTFQDEDGRFRLSDQHVRNRVHYHCYAVEGLISFLSVYEDKKLYEAAKRGAEFLQRYQKSNGGFWNRICEEENDHFEDIPPVAQAINIWRYFDKIELNTGFQESIIKAQKYLSSVQYRSFSPYLNGGFPFFLPEKSYKKKACSWACIFAIDTEVEF